MSHTLRVIAGGLALLGLFLVAGRVFGGAAPAPSIAAAARWFIPFWLIAAGLNLWIGVTKAGYSVAEEAPIFLVVFALPGLIAALVAWRLR